MTKKIIKAVVLVVVFLTSLVVISALTGTDQADLTSEMSEATLPVICLKQEEQDINELIGYMGDMDALSIRDSITPLSADMELPVTIQAFQNHVESISYEIRSLDMERLIQRSQVQEFLQENGIIQTNFQIENLLEQDEEYRLIISLECEGEEIRYYTRIIKAENSYVEESVEFALDFHAKTFDDSQVSQLATYLEPNDEGDNTTLQKVTIHSSLNQVAWGEFQGQVLKDPIPSIMEINSTYNSVVLRYVMTSREENGETRYYNVEEYYRVRYSTANQRLLLLDYTRTMDEIFRGNSSSFGSKGIILGIRDLQVDYAANEQETSIAFVQEGDLWSYNCNTNQLSRVFSFRGVEGISFRENNMEHDIRIIKVAEDGSVDFVVYGYMNRGDHQGYTGVALYHYDSVANTIQESLFVQSQEAYQVMKETWGRIFYVNEAEEFYMLAGQKLHEISLTTGESQILQEGLDQRNFAVSDNGRYIAWQEAQKEGTLTVTDLEEERQWQIQGGTSEQLWPIGFVESDFVYGISQEENSEYLSKLVIVDQEQQPVKEYEKAGYYVSHAYVEQGTVYLERVWKNGNTYVSVDSDAIRSSELEAARNISLGTLVTEIPQTQARLNLGREISSRTLQLLTPRAVLSQTPQELQLESETSLNCFYVYLAGRVELYTHDLERAVQEADASAGVVIDQSQHCIWRRGYPTSVSMVDRVILSQEDLDVLRSGMSRCVTALLQAEGQSLDISGLAMDGRTPADILQDALASSEHQVLDLTGCSVSQILYYLGRQSVVLTRDQEQPLLLVGYDERNVIVYDPRLNETYRTGRQDLEEELAQAGNVFVTYWNE